MDFDSLQTTRVKLDPTEVGEEDADNELRIHIKTKLMRAKAQTASFAASRSATRAGKATGAGGDAFGTGGAFGGGGAGLETLLPGFKGGDGIGGDGEGQNAYGGGGGGVGEGGEPPEDPTTRETHPITGRVQEGVRFRMQS